MAPARNARRYLQCDVFANRPGAGPELKVLPLTRDEEGPALLAHTHSKSVPPELMVPVE